MLKFLSFTTSQQEVEQFEKSGYRMALLYDFYGDVLTERQKEFYDLYYNEDLSLSEIAENSGITRQRPGRDRPGGGHPHRSGG